MEILRLLQVFGLGSAAIFVFLLWKILHSCCILPSLADRKLRENGFGGPPPSFPFGNLDEMRKSGNQGKVFIYWLGTEPFLYIADPEFVKKMSAGVLGKTWGKPTVFKNDREPMFGKGLVMVEGDDWVRQRHVITPAFTPSNLKGMAGLMVESAKNMVERWAAMMNSGSLEIDVEREITSTTAEIIAKTSFGISYEKGQKVFDKLRAMQMTLFKSARFVGVPFGKYMCPKQTLEAKNLGKEIDALVLAIIEERKRSNGSEHPHNDLLSLLLAENQAKGKGWEVVGPT
nr:cytokinin hydroxylase [Ipomoea batatas]GMC96353.1 cytokinin hydroxylase [Ipomoea batatas]